MNVEFNPIPRQTDIINRMAESGEKQKPNEGSRRPDRLSGGEIFRNRKKSTGGSRPSTSERTISLSFGNPDVRDVGEIVAGVQAQETGAMEVHKDQAEALKRFLGLEEVAGGEFQQKSFEEQVVKAQKVLRSARFVNVPEKPDLEDKVALEMLNRAADESEERLTVEKVRERAVVSERSREPNKAQSKPEPASHRSKKPPEKAVVIKGEKGQLTYVVSSYPHLENLPGEKVVQVLEEKGVPVKPDPDKWDKANSIMRKRWLKDRNIFNTVELPETVELYSNENNDVKVFRAEDGTVVITGSGEKNPDLFSASRVNSLLEQAGIDQRIDFPKNWESLSFVEKNKWLKDKGVRLMPAISGGAMEPPDYGNDGEEEATPEATPTLSQNFIDTVNRLDALYRAGANAADHPQNAEWQRLRTNLESLRGNITELSTSNRGYSEISSIARRVAELDHSVRRFPDNEARINSIISAEDREGIRREFAGLNRAFFNQYDALTRDDRARILGDLDIETNQLTAGMRSGLYGFEEVRVRLTRAARIAREQHPEDADLIEWRLVNTLTSIRDNQLESLFKHPPVDWKDSEKHLSYILQLVESTEFSPEELDGTLREAKAMVLQISLNLNDEELDQATKMKARLTERIEAVQSMYNFFYSMELNDMDPDQVGNVFKSFKDKTFKVWFDRFTLDEEGREFDFQDAEGRKVKFNVQDELIKVIMKRLRNERIENNMVEGFTLVGIDKDPSADDIKLMGKIVGREFRGDEIARIRELRGQLWERLNKAVDKANEGKADADKISAEKYWKDNKKDFLSDWYRTQTLIGAHGVLGAEFSEEPWIGVGLTKREWDELRLDNETDLLTIRKAQIKKDLQDILGEKLRNIRANEPREDSRWDDTRIEKLLGSGLMDQVVNNGYRMTWAIAWSDYDGLRVWDRDAKTPKKTRNWISKDKKGRIVEYIYNQSTNMYHGRFIDHALDNFIDEQRGLVGETNWLFQDAMLGARGNLLPQNRTLVRFAGQLASGKENKKGFIDENGNEVGFDERWKGKRNSLKNIDRLDVDRGSHKGDEHDNGWARGAAVSELIDSGDLNLDDANWSEAFGQEEHNITKYSMIDLYGDRSADKKFLGSGVLQKYLIQAGTPNFIAVNDYENFYSKRPVRMNPWTKLALPAHLETGRYYKDWWRLQYDMEVEEWATLVDKMIIARRMRPEFGQWMKGEYIGNPAYRFLRYRYDTIRVASIETAKDSWVLLFFYPWEILKASLSQSKAQFEGR